MKDKYFMQKQSYDNCRVLLWIDFAVLISMTFFVVSYIGGPRFISYCLSEPVCYNEGNLGRGVYIFSVVMYIISLIMLKFKTRFAGVWPCFLHCFDVLFAVYQVFETIKGKHYEIEVSVYMLMFVLLEFIEAYIYFNYIRRCKNIRILSGENGHEPENTVG